MTDIRVAALIELSKYKLNTIVTTLITVLENVTKPTIIQRPDEYAPPDILQSQLFLLRILSACMNHYWDYYQTSTLHDRSMTGGHPSPAKDSLPEPPIDPPPFEDILAKHITVTMARFIYQIGILEERDYGFILNHPHSSISIENYTNSSPTKTQSCMLMDIYKAASRVISFVSASNWSVVFSKIRYRIQYLTNTQEENPDAAEFMILECASLNAHRLGMVFTELCASSLHFKKGTHLLVASILRRTIWNWIENYTAEFTQLVHEKKKMSGSPEILFDLFNSLADTTKKKAVFWPLQTLLLLLCPDVILSSVQGSPNNKKLSFISSLKVAMKTDKMTEIAAICYVDFCKATTYLFREDMVTMQQVIPNLVKDMVDSLFNMNKLSNDTEVYYNSIGIHIDHRYLLADCVVTMFRIDTQKTIDEIIPFCIGSSAATRFRMGVVKAAVMLASERNRMPWIPSTSTLYHPLCGLIRELFLDYCKRHSVEKADSYSLNSTISSRKIIIPNNDKQKYKRETRNYSHDGSELILDVLRLYQIDPKFAILGDGEDKLEQNAAVMVSITNCLRDSSAAIRDAATECLHKLHTPECILLWGKPDDFIESYWKISSQVLYALAKQLLDTKEHDNRLRKLLELLKRLLVAQNNLFEQNRDLATCGIDTRERLQSSIGLEVSLLTLLCSADSVICTLTIECFSLLCTEVHLTERLDDMQPVMMTITENMKFYTELTNQSSVVPGRRSQQRHIRRLLRSIDHSSPGMLAACEEAWKRWKYLSPLVIRDDSKEDILELRKGGGYTWHDKLRNNANKQSSNSTPFPNNNWIELPDDEKPSEWQNYAGFLAALGGVCLMKDSSYLVSDKNRHSDISLINQAKYLSVSTESLNMIDKFIMEMVDLLLSDNVIVREWVREILGNDLSPALYHIMFRHTENMLVKCFNSESSEPICEPRYTLFVEQAISVLKLVLDRLVDRTDNLFTVDFSTLIGQYAVYLNKLGINLTSIKIKIKMCQLVEVLMNKKDRITLRQEFKLRNKLLEIIVEWTSEFTLKPNTTNQTSQNEKGDLRKLQEDLDLACLKTIVALLHQLPLQPPEPVHESDILAVKSRIFYKYFTYFFRLLNRCRVLEMETTKQTRDYDNQFIQRTNLPLFKNYTILAFSNLLSANVDAGLKYSFSMGYHEDTRTRSAFMEVLSNILNQGTEFDTLSETVMTDRYEKLIDMLVQPDLNIALSICEVCSSSDIDDVAHVLLACFASRNKAMVIVKSAIEREVQNTDTEAELFRKTSIATRLLSVYAKKHGAEYVKSVLLPVFQKLSDRPRKNKCFELDPSKIHDEKDFIINKHNVIEATEMFLDAICNSVNEAPKSFREMCNFILTAVRERFPEAKYTAVGAFVFLRFFCPAIVSPESEGLIKNSASISKEMRRGLLIVTKVIQNLANNVLFGAKETYMIVLNDFLTSNIYKVASFLREISKVPQKDVDDDVDEVFQMDDESYALLHNVLNDNMERMTRNLATNQFPHNRDPEFLSAWRKEFDKFANLLAQLGRPPEVHRNEQSASGSYMFAASNQLYADFMRRNNRRTVDSIVSKNIFYEGGVSKAGRPVFYLVVKHINVASIDFELLIYYILKTLERTSNRSYELLIDLTEFSRINEVPFQWIQQLLQLLSDEKIDNIATVHIYNPDSFLRTFIKKFTNPISHKLIKKIIFAVTLAEIYEQIPQSEVRLPSSTIALEMDPNVVFFPVNKILPFRVQIPVTVKVNAEYIQVMTVRKQEICYGLSSITNDIFHISEIEDVISVPYDGSTDQPLEFSFKSIKDNYMHVFSSPKRDSIVNTIQHSQHRYHVSRPKNISERTIRPSDVPGRLLNMALLNLGSDNPILRLSSYNLLYSLSKVFNFDIGKQLLDAKDLCLPSNSTEFIVAISEKIAVTEPRLTMEFLNECLVGYGKSEKGLRYLCLLYMIPWLPNLSLYCGRSSQETEKTKELLRLLIDITLIGEMYKLVQAKIWKTIGKVDEILNLVIETFLQFSNEHGLGSIQAEAMADTMVTLSNVTVRAKLIATLRKIIQRTSFIPTRMLTNHGSWLEITILLRFILMLSFNNRGPVKTLVPEIFYIITLVAGIGPTLVRATVHGIVINTTQSLSTSMPLSEANRKKMQLILSELSESKCRLLFGLNIQSTNAFTITPETLGDCVESISLVSLGSIVNKLSEIMICAAPTTDIANFWRARWMSLVASTTFQFNPAIQPRAFVALGFLGREEIDDDLLYQILVALRGALAIFNESDSNLVISIMMCLKHVVGSLPNDSRYLPHLFWIAVSLIEINSSSTFDMAVQLLQAVLEALDMNQFFSDNSISHVLMNARESIKDIAQVLDRLCGVNFEEHFSFAIAGTLMKGLRCSDTKNTIYEALSAFLKIERKRTSVDGIPNYNNIIEAPLLGYLSILLPIAAKHEIVEDLLSSAGLSDIDVKDCQNDKIYSGIFDKFDIPDNSTALLTISLLSTMLNAADNESERLFIYGLLSEAAVAVPEVFTLIYDSLLPKMNQIVVSSQTQPIIDYVKSILLTACSDTVFLQPHKNRTSQKLILEKLGFSTLADASFGIASCNLAKNAKLSSELIERIIL
ncbi:hypothetical protein BDB01DRAFT_790689 [Pilobolus umbonatus]|nr:hypothetical protein BDB01DRAFT_790689 [Pilobolus umbonatus]